MVSRPAADIRFGTALKRVMSHSRLYPAMEYGSLDVVKFEEDFLGDTIDGNKYTLANGGGASANSSFGAGGGGRMVVDYGAGSISGLT